MGELEKSAAFQDVSFAQLLPLLTALKKSCIERNAYLYTVFNSILNIQKLYADLILGEGNPQVTRMQGFCHWVITTHPADNPNLQRENIQSNSQNPLQGESLSPCVLRSPWSDKDHI